MPFGLLQKTITAVRSTNFLSRLLSGVKSAATDVKQDKLTTKVTPGSAASGETAEETATSKKPGWKRVAIVEDEEPQGMLLLYTGRVVNLVLRKIIYAIIYARH